MRVQDYRLNFPVYYFPLLRETFLLKEVSSSELGQKLRIDSRACDVSSSKSVPSMFCNWNIRDKGELSANNSQQWRCRMPVFKPRTSIRSRQQRRDERGCMRSTSSGDFSREKD